MTTIARYRAIDVIRQHRRRPEAPLDEEDWSQVRADEAGPMELTGQSSEADALQRCLEALSEAQRRCIRLAFFQGLTHGELCERLQTHGQRQELDSAGAAASAAVP